MARPDNNFDTGAEDAVLSTLLLYPEARELIFSRVGPQNFSNANRMNLFVGMLHNHRNGLNINPDAACNMILTQDERCPRQQLPFIPEVKAYVNSLLSAVSSPDYIETYCEIILSRPEVIWKSPEELRKDTCPRSILHARVKRLKAELAVALEALGRAVREIRHPNLVRQDIAKLEEQLHGKSLSFQGPIQFQINQLQDELTESLLHQKLGEAERDGEQAANG